MKTLVTDTLIIGAGPAGLACAMELSKENKDFIIVEKSSFVGGLSKTYTFSEGEHVFYTDNGPHRFFSKNPYLYDFIENLLKQDWIQVRRYTRQYIDGKFYDYPINPIQSLKNLGFKKALTFFIDYVIAFFIYKVGKKKVDNFEDYIIAHFGKSLGQFNMINYTEKIWGIPANTIHPDWATQRIKGLDLIALIKNMVQRIFLKKSKQTPKSLIETFYYPRKGTGEIYEAIHERLVSKGYTIMLDASPTSIVQKNNKVTSVIIKTKSGEDVSISFNYLVESIPLTEMLPLLNPVVPYPVVRAAKTLRYRSQVYLFITLDKESITPDQWIYFPAKDIPFGRVSEMKNFSSYMSPEGKTSLFIEFFCFEGDEIWNKDKDQLFDFTVPFFEKMNFFTRSEVRKYYLVKQRNAYPIYDLLYKNNLDVIKGYLDSIENLYYIGRPGRFRYNNQDHSLEMGIEAARAIIENYKPNFDKIGGEKEYFEKGTVPPKNK